MPNLEQHCKHSEKRYGIRGEEIHSWMDEPSQIAGGSHRDFRHDLSSLQTAIQLFGKLYGSEMVENIFLDHLKADSTENRIKTQLINENLGGQKLWNAQEDDYLASNFLIKSDAEIEAELKTKPKYSIQKRRQYLGLMRPRIIERTSNHLKEQRLVFKLARGQKIFLEMSVLGGNNDVDFVITNNKGDGLKERITGYKKMVFTPISTDNYSFIFSNSFSWFRVKQVDFKYNFENGRNVRININL